MLVFKPEPLTRRINKRSDGRTQLFNLITDYKDVLTLCTEYVQICQCSETVIPKQHGTPALRFVSHDVETQAGSANSEPYTVSEYQPENGQDEPR